MSGRTVPLLLVPRFTTYVGADEFPSMGIDVAPFGSAVVHLWRGQLVGSGSSVAFRFEEAMEDSWSVCSGGASVSPGAATVQTLTLTLSKRFLRAVVALSGVDPAVTAHVFGYLVPRSGATTEAPTASERLP